jgi:epoxyqueuosine reductase
VNTKAHHYTNLIKNKAYSLGFDFVGVSKVEFLNEEAVHLENWLKKGYQAKMHYMEDYFDLRLNPTLLVDDAKSVVSFLLNYFPDKEIQSDYKVSKYAYGKDYHNVIKKKLKKLLKFIREEIGEVSGRGFVDSAPVMDKAWAKRSGLGWIGKNANLINKQAGSYFFVSELILDLELVPDAPIQDFCGTCNKCIEECPTDAIVAPGQIDGSRCISYLTIELKNQLIPNEFKGKLDNWMFGCDVCMDVCPWNKFAKPHQTPQFKPSEQLLQMSKRDWEEITEDIFNTLFQGSPLQRTQYQGIKRNIKFLGGNE